MHIADNMAGVFLVKIPLKHPLQQKAYNLTFPIILAIPPH